MDRDLHHRTHFHRPPIPTFEAMPRSQDPGIPMTSLESDDLRPNRVLSGDRKFTRTFYTGPTAYFDNHASKIVAKMEQDEALMEDTPFSEQLRKEALRELPQCLTMKRTIKKKLSKSVSQKSKRKRVSWSKNFTYKLSLSWTNFKERLVNFNYFELWHGSLKDIEGHFGSGYASYFKFLRWLFVMNFFVAVLTFSLLAVPQIIYDISEPNNTIQNTQPFRFEDIFMGKGSFEETILYYGHYTNITFSFIPYLYFDMPAAYFSVNVALYLFSVIVLGVSVAKSYNRTFIETEGGLQNVYANKIFCGWDYGIATKEAAELKSSSIYRELKELLSESYNYNWDRTCLDKLWTYTIQLIVNILILALLVGLGWALWLLLDRFALEQNISVLITTVVVNIVIMIFPIIFNYISKYEDYKNPRTALYITLIRTYLLGGAILGAILLFWLSKADSLGNTDCWENYLAVEVYRLILFDFIFSVLLTPIIEIVYSVVQRMRGKGYKFEFNIARHTLQIIYNQGLFWVGLFYSPLFPVIITIKMLVIWYLRKGCVRKFCKPPKRTWRAAQAQTVFMMMTFISIVLIVGVHGYTMKSIPTSNCGPLQYYNYSYEILAINSQNLQDDHTFWMVVLFITRPGAIAFVIIGLCIIVYYIKEQAYAEKEKVKMLREMLVWMAKDKKFLVQWYTDVTKENFNHNNLRNDRFMDPCQVLPQEYDNSDYSASTSSLGDDEFNARFKKYT